jgi:hypothetical protein
VSGTHKDEGAQRSSFVEVFVDYSLVGKATEFSIDLAHSAASGLQPGNRFIVTGDAVPTFVAEVCELLDDGWRSSDSFLKLRLSPI